MRKFNLITAAVLLACGGFSTGALAQSISINPASATAGVTGGATTPAGLNVVFTAGGNVVGYQTDIDFDNTQMSVALTNGNADSCVLFDPNTVRIQDVDGALAPLPSGTACTLTFTLNNPQTAGTNYALNVTGTLCSDNMSMPVACTETDGQISIVAGPTSPDATFVPAPDADGTPDGTAEVTIPAGAIGSTGTSTITVNATAGTMGATTTLACAATGAVTVAPTNQTIATDGTNTDLTVSCTRTAMAQTGTVTCTETASTGGSTSNVFDVLCEAGITAPEVTPNPASGSTINVSGAPSTTLTATFSLGNQTGTAPLTATCTTATAGFTVTPAGAQTIAPGASLTFTVTGTYPATAGQAASATVTCTTNDADEGTITYTVTGTAVNLSVPTLGDLGKLLMVALVLGLGLLGFTLNRRAA